MKHEEYIYSYAAKDSNGKWGRYQFDNYPYKSLPATSTAKTLHSKMLCDYCDATQEEDCDCREHVCDGCGSWYQDDSMMLEHGLCTWCMGLTEIKEEDQIIE